MAAIKRTPKHILVIDVGGTRVKLRLDAHGTIRKFVSGPGLTPDRMLRRIDMLAGALKFDAVAIGYPGVVLGGRIAAEPHNLGTGWVGFDFAQAFECPVKVVNDAALQALGCYQGGKMLFLGLGTGLGSAMIVEGIVEP